MLYLNWKINPYRDGADGAGVCCRDDANGAGVCRRRRRHRLRGGGSDAKVCRRHRHRHRLRDDRSDAKIRRRHRHHPRDDLKLKNRSVEIIWQYDMLN